MDQRMLLASLFTLLTLRGSAALGGQEPKPATASGSTQSASGGSTGQGRAENNPKGTPLSAEPETMEGTVTMVVRREGLLVLTLTAKTPPKKLSVESRKYDSVEGERTVHHRVTTTVLQSEDVDYDFRVTDSTAIWLAGKRVGLAVLEGATNRAATVRFVPKASGDIAGVIQIK